MIVDNIQVAFFCSELKIDNKEIRRQIEDSLNEFSFSFFNFPPVEGTIIAPSMIGQTPHGHSRLQIEDKVVRLFVAFDEVFRHDRNKCFDYAFNKIDVISHMICEINKQFSTGIVVQYLFDDEKYTANAISLINRDSVVSKNKQIFFNFSKNFSIIYQDRYYLNFKLSSMHIKGNNDCLVGIGIDINNRYGKETKGEDVGYEDVLSIMEIHKQITDITLDKLLILGELDLNGNA